MGYKPEQRIKAGTLDVICYQLLLTFYPSTKWADGLAVRDQPSFLPVRTTLRSPSAVLQTAEAAPHTHTLSKAMEPN
jgi:hypothetical protein